MNNNFNYWNNNKELSNLAKIHTAEMENKYINEIRNCIQSTVIYDDITITPSNVMYRPIPNIIIDDLDSVSAIFKYNNFGKIAVLNFASYKNPGGSFLEGSSAQEESLCHKSYLYSVLSSNMNYYDYNRKNLNKGLYTNRALYSPNIRFFNNDNTLTTFCDVITCAAPNYSAAGRYKMVTAEENFEVLKSRCKFILDIAHINSINTLILGAFGCGVFGQNPTEVATIFKNLIKYNSYYTTENFIFAIPYLNSNNYICFKNILEVI